MGAVLRELGGALHAGQVRPGAGLGHGQRPHLLAGDELGQVALLLLLGRQGLDVGEPEQYVDTRAAEVHAGAGGLLGLDGLELVGIDPRAAVLLVDVDAEQAEVGELVVELTRDDAGLEPLLEVGGHLGLDEVTEGLAEGLVVFVEHSAAQVRAFPLDVLLRWQATVEGSGASGWCTPTGE